MLGSKASTVPITTEPAVKIEEQLVIYAGTEKRTIVCCDVVWPPFCRRMGAFLFLFNRFIY